MKKSDLIIYRDRIKKLHKAAIAFKDAHDELEAQQKKVLSNKPTINDDDWDKLVKFMNDNTDLSDKLKEVETILKVIAK